MLSSHPNARFRKLFFSLLAIGAAFACVRAQADDASTFDSLDVPPLPKLFLNADANEPAITEEAPPPAALPAIRPPAPVEELPMILPAGSPPATTAPAGAATSSAQDEEWVVHIIPGPSRKRLINGQSYEEVYQSIPFKKAEYRANPGYRHEATMEVVFGQQRPTTIVNHRQPEVIPLPQYSRYQPYRYGTDELQWNYRPMLVPRLWNPYGLHSVLRTW